MKKHAFVTCAAVLAVSAVFLLPSESAKKEIILVKPKISGGIPLMSALGKRQTSRSFSGKPLASQTLSDLLWAANGINRPGSGKRTAPSAVNRQEIDIYIATADGTYLYVAKKHSLVLVVAGDLRGMTGSQGFVKSAPINLVYVADMSKVAGNSREDKLLYAGADTGFIGQNVYLFCASEGLVTVIRGYVDREALGKALGLKSNQMIILSQTVGYPGN